MAAQTGARASSPHHQPNGDYAEGHGTLHKHHTYAAQAGTATIGATISDIPKPAALCRTV